MYALSVFVTALLLQDAEPGFEKLCNGKDLSGWKFEGHGQVEKAFAVDGDTVKCKGRPVGFMYTEKSYRNFTLRFDWKFVRPENLKDDSKFWGNSGYLLWISGGKALDIWPRSIEVQGMWRDAGRILPIPRDVKCKIRHFEDDRKKAMKPVGEWNSMEIVAKDGTVVVTVNGARVAEVTECELKEGPIGFQSEGAEIHWRNIRIKVEGVTTLSGKLERKDVEGGCWILRDHGTTYDLHGDLSGFNDGDEVVVTGQVQTDAACKHMTGTVFKVQSIKKKE